MTPGAEIVLDRELGEDPPTLQNLNDAHTDNVGGVSVVDSLAAKLDRAFGDVALVHTEEPADAPQDRGLPGTVRPQQGDD